LVPVAGPGPVEGVGGGGWGGLGDAVLAMGPWHAIPTIQPLFVLLCG
jgi:hypothetical protein